MLRQVDVDRLSLGMYVAELDRPWLETPFTVQGFYLRTLEDIRQVADLCSVVMVDPRRYDPQIAEAAGVAACDAPAEVTFEPGQPVVPSDRYRDIKKLEEELPAAKQALSAGVGAFEDFWSELTSRRQVPVESLKAAVDPLVSSILRNKDALVTLMRVQHFDRNTHEHCMALAVWGSLLGRQLGLSPDQIRNLALGCSLVDIGKIEVPKEMLYKAGKLTPEEYQTVKSHVVHSLQMVDEMGAPEEVVNTVRWHHERLNGSGYPDGLKGDEIPMFARIAGIVDSYDAMISPRVYAETASSYQAMVELQKSCPELFQTELVELFAQSIGLFPNGALVELSTGEVGVVCGQNPGRRLRPKVMLILDGDKEPRDDLLIVDLKVAAEQEVRISRELARNEYGIDAAEYFL
ncbi:MAG: HD-GYP domain-containing protein [Pseudomonadales bacterium]